MELDEDEVNKSSQVFAVCWVKQKAAKSIKVFEDSADVDNSNKIEHQFIDDESSAENYFDQKKTSLDASRKKCDSDSDVDGENAGDDCFDDLKEFDFDNYDNEAGNPELDGISNLYVYASNYDDPYLCKSKYLQEEDKESDDLNLVETDNLLVCARCEKDYAQLDVYVYNDLSNDFYIHHDLPLPSPPLCLQWLDFNSAESTNENFLSNQGNYIAVGNLNSVIAVWDLNVVNTLEPAFTLGVPKKKYKHMVLEGKENFGHRDAVLDLSWTALSRNTLASASADHLVAIWDLEKLNIKRKIEIHSAKVQTLSWQPHSNSCMLSGAFNGQICVSDLKAPSSNHWKWHYKDEIEKVAWNQTNADYFAASTSTGKIFYCDIRKPGKDVLSFKAHGDAIPALAVTSSMLYSGSSDGSVKVWNICDGSITLKQKKPMNMGMVHCFQFNPDALHIMAIGGQKNGVKLWNLKSDKQKAPNEVSTNSDDERNDVVKGKKSEKICKQRRKKGPLCKTKRKRKKAGQPTRSDIKNEESKKLKSESSSLASASTDSKKKKSKTKLKIKKNRKRTSGSR